MQVLSPAAVALAAFMLAAVPGRDDRDRPVLRARPSAAPAPASVGPGLALVLPRLAVLPGSTPARTALPNFSQAGFVRYLEPQQR